MKEQVDINGRKFWVRTERREQDIEIIHEVFVRDSYRLRHIASLGYRPNTILDIGGHIGSFAVLAKSIWPEVTIIGCEPHRESCELYRDNIADLPNATVLNVAVAYDATRSVLLHAAGSTGGCVLKNLAEARALESSPSIPGQEHYSIIQQEVPTITIEQILADAKLSGVDLLKLDCEGSELNILPSLSSGVAQSVSLVVGEYHIDGGVFAFDKVFKQCFPNFHLTASNPFRAVGTFWAGRSALVVYSSCLTSQLGSVVNRCKRILGSSAKKVVQSASHTAPSDSQMA